MKSEYVKAIEKENKRYIRLHKKYVKQMWYEMLVALEHEKNENMTRIAEQYKR